MHGAMVVVSLIAETKNIDDVDKTSLMDQTMFFITNTRTESVKALVVQLISLTGVYLMWRIKKIGFYIYFFAESFLLFQFVHVLLTSFAGADIQSIIQVALEMIWPLPLDLAFIIMYATQLKHMTWKLKTITADTQA
jgi:hypothetical protein